MALLPKNLQQKLLSSPAGNQWASIGIRHHHGIQVALFSLYTENSAGIGEYADLIPLITWCKEVGFNLIQLLPLNDTGEQNAPYSALSAFALNPIHIKLTHLPGIKEHPSLQKIQNRLKTLNNQPLVDYPSVRKGKEEFLRLYYSLFGTEIVQTESYQRFLKDNPWLPFFTLFKARKIAHNWSPWSEWEQIDEENYTEERAYHTFVQYLCFQEMQAVHDHAKKMGVFLKGDIPILVNAESDAVWHWPHLFHLDYSAGSPPDRFAPKGQNWNFPIYNWEEHEKEGYNFWKTRLHAANSLYDIYRIDHIIGFFRIWAIPNGKTCKEGAFTPADRSLWAPQGMRILNMMLKETSLFPIGEDLGTVPQEVRDSMLKLGICGTRVLTDPESIQKGLYPSLDTFPPESISTLSTHDLEPFSLWWKTYPKEATAWARTQGWDYHPLLADSQLFSALRDSHHTTSLFHINPLQEYLQLIPTLKYKNPEDTRINLPGTESPQNWSFRFRESVEMITKNPLLKNLIPEIIQ